MTIDIKDINKALIEIHHELDKKAGLASTPKDGSSNRALAIRNGAAVLDDSAPPRLHEKYAIWFWRSNSLSSNGLVVWDAESANSDPQSIIWDRFRSGFILVPGGLYEISFGFFGSSKPIVEVLLNDSPILASRVGKDKDKISGPFEALHASGNVTGLTCLEYVILPPKAKLSVAIKGNVTYEGFFLIKKL